MFQENAQLALRQCCSSSLKCRLAVPECAPSPPLSLGVHLASKSYKKWMPIFLYTQLNEVMGSLTSMHLIIVCIQCSVPAPYKNQATFQLVNLRSRANTAVGQLAPAQESKATTNIASGAFIRPSMISYCVGCLRMVTYSVQLARVVLALAALLASSQPSHGFAPGTATLAPTVSCLRSDCTFPTVQA